MFSVCPNGLTLFVLGQRRFAKPRPHRRPQPRRPERGRIDLPKHQKNQTSHQVQFNYHRL